MSEAQASAPLPCGGQELDRLVGESPIICAVRDQIRELAATDYTLHVEGESGTGKDLVAWLLHALSARAQGPFVVVNCAALPESLFESEVFGHDRGAFTGASASKVGLLESADKGTLFLDEIAELSPGSQAKLLRVLETGSFNRLGRVRPLHVDVRVVAATNRELSRLVAEGKFRADLYYRLRVIALRVPPLRERGSDITLLARHFLQEIARHRGAPALELSVEAENALARYDWPGNIRQLLHEMQGACVRARAPRIELEDLSEELRGTALVEADCQDLGFCERRRRLLLEWERREFRQELERAGWNISAAARRLQLDRRTLYTKMELLGIARPGRRCVPKDLVARRLL